MKLLHTTAFMPSCRQRQRGVMLLISLIMLIALTLGGLALFRLSSTGLMVAGNLAFKRAALIASDRGSEAARAWMMSGAFNNPNVPSVAAGYYPGWCHNLVSVANIPDSNNDGKEDDCRATPSVSTFDPLTFDWSTAPQVTNDDGNGNEIRYVIHRMCRIPGSLNTTNADGVPQECITLGSANAGGSKESTSYGASNLKGSVRPFYRITTRAVGPRNTVAYTQVSLN